MGLDSYIYRASKEAVQSNVDFRIDRKKYNVEEFAYFRKNSALHSFCEHYYNLFGGSDKDFNCCNLWLTQDIVKELRIKLNKGELSGADGFFWELSDVTDIMLKSYEQDPEYVFVYNGNY